MSITLASYEKAALRFVSLEGKSDPIGILRKGLIEEVCEVIDTSPSQTNELQKEIGDVLWYLTAINNFHGQKLTDILGGGYDQRLQNVADGLMETMSQLPILGESNMKYVRSDDFRAALLFDTFRVVDSINPKTPALWRGISESDRNLCRSSTDCFISLGLCAAQFGLDLDSCATATLSKLGNRTRKPHVVTEKDTPVVDSLRGRVVTQLSRLGMALLPEIVDETQLKPFIDPITPY